MANINGIALGLMGTRGRFPAIEAADAMTKAAEVPRIGREFIGGRSKASCRPPSVSDTPYMEY